MKLVKVKDVEYELQDKDAAIVEALNEIARILKTKK